MKNPNDRQTPDAQSGTARVLMLCTLFLFTGLIGLSYCGGERKVASVAAGDSGAHPRDLLPQSGSGLNALRELADPELDSNPAPSASSGPKGAFPEHAGRAYQIRVDDRERTIRVHVFRRASTSENRVLRKVSWGAPQEGGIVTAHESRIPGLGDESSTTTGPEGTWIVFRRGDYDVVMDIDGNSPGAQTFLGLLASDIDNSMRR